jgi:hypothetical protein
MYFAFTHSMRTWLRLYYVSNYIDRLKPVYNIVTRAGSSINLEHSEKTVDKLKYRRLSAESLSNLKAKIGAAFIV